VNRGVAGNVNTGNAVAWNNGNVYTDHKGAINSYSRSDDNRTYGGNGWQSNDSRSSSWGGNTWDQSRWGNRANNFDSQGFGRSMGSQRFSSFRSSGGGGFGRSFSGRSFSGRRR
jgi:hypothetical protein